jgi:beta-xylosidase
MNGLKKIITICFLVFATINLFANGGKPKPGLHVEGRYLKDPHGNIVNLHGFAQTYSPWFNEQGKYWSNYNVAGCLNYNKGIIDKVLAAGWKVNFVRMHLDPYWSNIPGCQGRYEGEECFSETRFRKYLDEVFVPMAEYIISKGMYVVMRPPGVSPDTIYVGDPYNKFLIKVWGIVSQHPKVKNNPSIMFELANEPINILGPDGTYGASSQGHFDNLKTYFQAIVDTIRAVADNIIWVPGLGYQSLYQGYAVNPVEGENIGYAVHVYPGWFNSGQGYNAFQNGWNNQVKPVADFAPIIVTEMDWAPAKYNSSWGKDITGKAGGIGFGANFKAITDTSGNVSWLLFTSPDLLAKFDSANAASPGDTTFLNDPEACPWPCFHWYKDYAKKNYPRPDFTYLSHSDNGDSTYTNPVIFADFPDPDVIRVGDIYYMSTTTMHIFPGATILKSYDLVNWEYCCNPLEKIETTECYNLDGCNRYSRGQWASSLKYNNGKYYLHFNTLNEGSYLLTANNPEGPWIKKKLASSFYDGGLFFDNDGKTYIAYGINNIRIAELDSNFNVIQDKLITYGNTSGIDNSGTEGCHLYKINGYYYIYATTGGYYATQVAFRSNSIFGPYDEKEVLNDDRIHQGALIQTQTGEWWTMLFADKGAYGRLPNLQPVTWVDNWPMVGVNGKGVTTYKKPNVGRDYMPKALATNDNFRNYRLGKQWGWNHNPDNTKWSLFERPGYLRLRTVSVADSLHNAKNTLTQRILGYPSDTAHSYGTIKMEIDSMKEGDMAGLAVFQDPYGYIGIKIVGGEKKLMMENNKIKQAEQTITDSVVYLRAVANYNTSIASFYYSFDNITYTKFGTDLNMKFNLSIFTGNKFCLFNFPTLQTGGFVDIDWFSTEKEFSENTFYDSTFVAASEDVLTLTDLRTDKDTMTLLTGSTASISIIAVYKDGHTEDVSIGATYTNPHPEIVQVKNGRVIAKTDGQAIVTLSYKDLLGNTLSKDIHFISSTFPLVSGVFNPSIWESGTFDEVTHKLVTGTYGFGGWEYANGVNLSAYKYLVVELKQQAGCGFSFRVFDESSYWSACHTSNVGSNLTVAVKLSNMYKLKNSQYVKCDPSHIYRVGFWSYGGCPIYIKDVFLSNDDKYAPYITSLPGIPALKKDTEFVDVYTVMGVKLRSKVKKEQATLGLAPGIYIIGNRKVAVAKKF